MGEVNRGLYDTVQRRCFCQQHHNAGKDRADQRLDQIQPQRIYAVGKFVHKQDLKGECKCAADGQNITGADPGDTDTADAIKPGGGKGHTDRYHNGRFALKENADYRYDNDVHSGKKTGLSGIGFGSQTELLKIAGKKKRNAAQNTRKPEFFAFPAAEESAFFLFKQVCNGNYQQKPKHCEKAADSLKGKGRDMLRTKLLGNKSRTPYNGGKKQNHAATELLFHKNHRKYFSILRKKMQVNDCF